MSRFRHHRYFPYRVALLVGIFVILPLGYGVRFAADTWLNDFLGSVAYEILFILMGACLFPQISPIWIALWVCLATCLIEILQLWQNPLYLATKATFLGRLLLGNTFTGSDFPAYFGGSFVGWIGIMLIRQRWVR